MPDDAPAIHVFDDAGRLFTAAAERVVELARGAVAGRGVFHWALAGGSTPRGLYTLLADPPLRNAMPWDRVHVWFGDERCVGPDHAESNFRMAREALLAHVPVPGKQVHRIEGERTPQEAAERYAAAFDQAVPGGLDLALLGTGPDGHTASLFPGTDILAVRDRSAAAVYVPQKETWRVSLTYPALERARHTMFLVSGAEKAEMLGRVLGDAPQGEPLPVQRLRSGGAVDWYLDRAAAAQLKREER